MWGKDYKSVDQSGKGLYGFGSAMPNSGSTGERSGLISSVRQQLSPEAALKKADQDRKKLWDTVRGLKENATALGSDGLVIPEAKRNEILDKVQEIMSLLKIAETDTNNKKEVEFNRLNLRCLASEVGVKQAEAEASSGCTIC